MRYGFLEFELDDQLFELRRGGALLAVQPKALDVLLCLLRNRERVVSKEELLTQVWKGVKVQANTLAQTVTALRRALDDEVVGRVIQTVRTRGYRFVADVTESETGERATPPPAKTALVGRAGVLETLLAALEAAHGQRPAIVLLPGAPGLGKTRVLAELAELARKRGTLVVQARCHRDAGAPELWPWVQALRALAADETLLDSSTADLNVRGLSELITELRAAGAPAAPGTASDERFQLFERVLGYLKHAARHKPLLLTFDDLHWADVPSLLLLAFMARELAESRLLVLCAYSDAGMPHALARTVGALLREDPGRRVALPPLGLAEIEELTRAELGQADREMVLRLHQKTAGNPALLLQLLRASAPHAESSVATQDTSALLADDGVREAIGLQVGTLSEDCQRLLSVAAVVGTHFELAALAQLAGVSTTTAQDTLAEATRLRVLRRTERPGEFCFVHALVRDVLCRRLSATRRAELQSELDKVL